MVSPKRLENGFNGYQVPVVPRASRSARGKVPLRKRSERNHIQAFEILAKVAGTFLLKNDNTIPTNGADKNGLDCIFGINLRNKQEDKGWLSKEEACELESSNENTVACVPRLQGNYYHQSYTSNTIISVQENISLNIDNLASKSCEFSDKLCFTESPGRFIGESSCHGYCLEGKGQDALEMKEANGLQNTRTRIEKNTCINDNREDTVKLDQKPVQVTSSGHCRNVPFLHDRINLNSFHGNSASGKVGSTNNDEKLGEYISSRATNGSTGQPSDMEDHKITTVSAYKNHRLDTNLKHCSSPLTDDNKNGMDIFAYERMQRLYPFKKRKFFKELSPVPDDEYQCEDISTSVNKFNSETPGSVGVVEASRFAVQEVCHKSNDCNVKLSIKSFRVPELFIEIPETATVGSLKRTVMEAVSSILRDEIHVGVLLQGKVVRDDSKTLVQTGIAQDDRKNRLGFMLEPRHTQTYPPSYIRTSLLSTGLPKQYSRQSASLTLQPESFSTSKETRPIKSESAEGDCNLVPMSASSSAGKTMSKHHALVAVPSINMEALAVIPYARKSGNPEFVQRRIRRPFSISEVEALVQAVEKLGTGRWRDVKVCAFDNVKHRTYVDLKDKWKTLVHTARISPQQRRGEPVPQQLLDRVLAAHAHWSQHSKQQIKAL